MFKNAETAATAAVKARKYQLLEELHKKGINLAEPNQAGETALDVCLDNYQTMSGNEQAKCRVAIFLLEHLTDYKGGIPFYIKEIFRILNEFNGESKEKGNINKKIANILKEIMGIEGRVDLTYVDLNGNNAFDLAKTKKLKSTYQNLVDYHKVSMNSLEDETKKPSDNVDEIDKVELANLYEDLFGSSDENSYNGNEEILNTSLAGPTIDDIDFNAT